MLNEMQQVRQVPGDYFRRCFADESLHLLVWYKADKSVYGFQLSYDEAGHPRALTWTEARGFSHAEIDAGEQSPLANRAPVLRPGDAMDAAALLARFQASAEKLPAAENALVQRKIVEFGREREG
jgi:hypothetical protein